MALPAVPAAGAGPATRSSASGWSNVVTDSTLERARIAGLAAFASPYSVNEGERPTLYVRSPRRFRVRVYRLGWYHGAGASLVYDKRGASPRNNAEGDRCGAYSSDAGIRSRERNYGLVECRWRHPVRLELHGARSGIFFARVTSVIQGATQDTLATFVVRNDSSRKRLVIVNPTTMAAYNEWSDCQRVCAWRSMYVYSGPRSTKVSMDRPMDKVPTHFKTDYPLLRFLERESLHYTVATDVDVAMRPRLLDHRRSVVLSGHGEYWSMATRDRLERFVLGGRSVVAMAGNTGYWQVRYERSHVGLPDPVVVGYKESATDLRTPAAVCRKDVIVPSDAANCADPMASDRSRRDDRYVTGRFRDPPVNRPEQALFGVQYQTQPASVGWELPLTLFTNAVKALRPLGRGIRAVGDATLGAVYRPTGARFANIGWEGDSIHPELLLRRDPGSCLIPIGASHWGAPVPGQADNQTVHLVVNRPTGSAGAVVSGLTMLWSWGLDDWAAVRGLPHSGPPISRVDPRVQQLTRNMLRAADDGSLRRSCNRRHGLDLHFATTTVGSPARELFLNERGYPGRWAVVPIVRRHGGVALTPRVNGLARLSGWANPSSAYEQFVADVNGDGRADLVAKEKRSPGNWYVATSTGTTFIPQPRGLRGWASPSSAYDQFVADVNGDGRADLIAKEKRSPGNWYVATSTGTTFAPQPRALGGWAYPSSAHELFVADVNGDGRADLIAKEKRSPGNWYVATSTGTTFAPQRRPFLASFASP